MLNEVTYALLQEAIGVEWRNDPAPQEHVVVLEDGPLRLGSTTKDHAAIFDHARELIAT